MLNYLLQENPTCDEGALEVPMNDWMHAIDRSEAALFLDGQMRLLARAHARLSLRLGEALQPMLKRSGYSALGYAKSADYCREELGASQSTAERMVRLHKGLQNFPLVNEAFLKGDLSECQVLLLLSRLPKLGDEAGWVEKARALTVRALEEELGAEATEPRPCPAGERHYRFTPGTMLDWHMGRELAGRLHGSDLNDAQFLEFLAAEFLAGPHPRPTDEPIPEEAPPPREPRTRELWKVLEVEYGRWDYFDWQAIAVQLSPELQQPLPELPHERQSAINDLFLCRRRLHLHLGRMLFTFSRLSLWRDSGFASLGHYAQERLGLSTTTVHRLITRERLFLENPDVHEAVRDGQLTVSQADDLASVLKEVPDSCTPAWIAFARGTTTRNLASIVKATCELAEVDRETFLMSNYLPPSCDERPWQIRGRARRSDEPVDLPALLGPIGVVVGWAATWIPTLTLHAKATLSLVVRVTEEILPVLEEAERVAGARTPTEAVQMFLDGFIATWSKADLQTRAQTRRLFEAADYRCQVPACTARVCLEAHHLHFRSQGGGNEDANLAVACKSHHHHGIHAGTIRATRTPDGAILWEMGIFGARVHRVFRNETLVSRAG